MTDARMPDETVVILDSEHSVDGCNITGEIDRSDPGDPCIRLEAGCNEFWLNYAEACAVRDYLIRTVPAIERGGENG